MHLNSVLGVIFDVEFDLCSEKILFVLYVGSLELEQTKKPDFDYIFYDFAYRLIDVASRAPRGLTTSYFITVFASHSLKMS